MAFLAIIQAVMLTSLSPLAYSMVADFIHHVRGELSPIQLAKVVKTYSAMMHNPATSGGFQTMCAKLLSTVTESVIGKHSREGAAETLYGLLECNVDKLMSVSLVIDELRKNKEHSESESSIYIKLEKSKPIYGATFVTENAEEVFKGESVRVAAVFIALMKPTPRISPAVPNLTIRNTVHHREFTPD